MYTSHMAKTCFIALRPLLFTINSAAWTNLKELPVSLTPAFRFIKGRSYDFYGIVPGDAKQYSYCYSSSNHWKCFALLLLLSGNVEFNSGPKFDNIAVCPDNSLSYFSANVNSLHGKIDTIRTHCDTYLLYVELVKWLSNEIVLHVAQLVKIRFGLWAVYVCLMSRR